MSLFLKRFYTWVLFSVVFVCFTASANSNTIWIVADEWCPYNCEPESSRPGYVVELAQRAFNTEGRQLRYSLVPWKRALRHTEQGIYHAAIGASVNEAPGFVLSDPVGFQGNVLVVRASSHWQYQGLQSLSQLRLAVVSGYDYGEQVQRYIDSANPERLISISGDDVLPRLQKALEAKRIDAYIENSSVVRYYLNSTGKSGLVRLAKEFEPFAVYLAFSPSLADSSVLAAEFNQTLHQMRLSGELNQLLARYGLEDWQQALSEHHKAKN